MGPGPTTKAFILWNKMKAIAVFCLMAMICTVFAKSKKDDNKGLQPCLPCMGMTTTQITTKPPTTKRTIKPNINKKTERKISKAKTTKRKFKNNKTTKSKFKKTQIITKRIKKILTTKRNTKKTSKKVMRRKLMAKSATTSNNKTRLIQQLLTVKIAVYYESLCPDSKAFIVQQLAPVWRDFRGVVKVKLVPYGKATHDKIDGKWKFNCHHGEDECYGNKVQSCILKHRALLDTEKMDLVTCLMSQTNPDKSLDTCLTQVNKMDESKKIKDCASGSMGDTLLAAYGDKTASVARPLSFVPTVVINEKYNQANQDEAFTNLKAVVCRVAVHKPAIC